MIKYKEENSMQEKTEQTIEAMDTSGKEPKMPGCMVRGPRGATPTGEEEPPAGACRELTVATLDTQYLLISH